jgi:protein phosphatase
VLRVAEYQAFSDTGRRRRHNEDAYFARTPVFVVADGMGGAQAGEVASRAAVDTFARGLPHGADSAERRLAELVRRANERIHAMSREDEARAGMGTTITAAHVGEHDVTVAHVGDSRAYRLRDGALERLTDDHSLVEEMRRRGQLTAEEADEHPQRSIITRALGPEPDVLVDTHTWKAQAGDLFLLCSDGLTSMVGEAQVADVLRRARGLEEAGRELVRAANDAGGADNITVVLFRLEDVGPVGRAADEPVTATHRLPPSDGAPATEAHGGVAVREATATRRRAPRPAQRPTLRPGPATSARRARARRRLTITAAVFALLVVPVVFGAWIASQAVYFVGTNPEGFVTMYRGLPYELPGGLDLYRENYVTPVHLTTVRDPALRSRLVEHELRSRDDAGDLLRRLERRELEGQ